MSQEAGGVSVRTKEAGPDSPASPKPDRDDEQHEGSPTGGICVVLPALDDAPEFLDAGPLGIALWIAGLARCSRHKSGGYLSAGEVECLLPWHGVAITRGMYGADADAVMVADLLVDAGLWTRTESGYLIRGFEDIVRWCPVVGAHDAA